MKLRTLAIAVAMASVATAAQADLKISGDVGVGYFKDTESVKDFGSEINFDASEKVGAVTYYGHMELEMGNGSANTDELRVGAKGGFGEVILGDADNGCNQVDIGGTNEVWYTHTQGGCKGESYGNVIYKRSMGAATMAVSHNPAAEQSTFGIKGAMGPVGVSLGYETDVTNGAAKDNNVVLGLTGKLGPVSVGFRANKLGDNEAVHGINALYSSGGNSIYGGLGTSDGNDSKSIGYTRTIGMTDFILEASDSGVAGADTDVLVGMRHRF